MKIIKTITNSLLGEYIVDLHTTAAMENREERPVAVAFIGLLHVFFTRPFDFKLRY